MNVAAPGAGRHCPGGMKKTSALGCAAKLDLLHREQTARLRDASVSQKYALSNARTGVSCSCNKSLKTPVAYA
jgi:hypothetical protein